MMLIMLVVTIDLFSTAAGHSSTYRSNALAALNMYTHTHRNKQTYCCDLSEEGRKEGSRADCWLSNKGQVAFLSNSLLKCVVVCR